MLLHNTKTRLLAEAFIRQLLLSNNINYIEFALNNFGSVEASAFHDDVIQLIQNSDKITASQIIRFLPRELIANHDFNHELWDLFDDVHFLAQKQILDQFLHCNQLSDKLLNNFITYAKEAKESLFIQILKIILNQSNIPLNKDQALLEIVKNKKENLSGAAAILLKNADYDSGNKAVRDEILKILK